MGLSGWAAIRVDAMSAGGACCCQSAAADVPGLLLLPRRLILLLLRLVAFGAGMIILELATTVPIIYQSSLRPRQAAQLCRLPQQAHNCAGGSVSNGCDP